MTRTQTDGQQHLLRLQLVARVQLAWENLRDATRRAHVGSRQARTAVVPARRRLALLNRAMALMALGASPVPA